MRDEMDVSIGGFIRGGSHLPDPKKPGQLYELPPAIGHITLVSEARTVEESEANARLMAAAPDLLAACRHVVQLFKDGAGEVHDQQRADGQQRTILEELTAAIAKAASRPE